MVVAVLVVVVVVVVVVVLPEILSLSWTSGPFGATCFVSRVAGVQFGQSKRTVEFNLGPTSGLDGLRGPARCARLRVADLAARAFIGRQKCAAPRQPGRPRRAARDVHAHKAGRHAPPNESAGLVVGAQFDSPGLAG